MFTLSNVLWRVQKSPSNSIFSLSNLWDLIQKEERVSRWISSDYLQMCYPLFLPLRFNQSFTLTFQDQIYLSMRLRGRFTTSEPYIFWKYIIGVIFAHYSDAIWWLSHHHIYDNNHIIISANGPYLYFMTFLSDPSPIIGNACH